MEDKKVSEECYSLVKIEDEKSLVEPYIVERYSFGTYDSGYLRRQILECPEPNYDLDWEVKDHKNDLFYDLCRILCICLFSYILSFAWEQIKPLIIVENPMTNEEIINSSSIEREYLGRK